MTMLQPAIEAAIDRAVTYLANAQRPDGGFDSYSSPSALRFKKTFTYRTTFVPALILTALIEVKGPRAGRLKRRLAGYLQAQAGPQWSFNYWDKASPERQRLPYPDDLDDTCCALAALALHDPEAVGADVLAGFVKLLVAAEQKVGGPYRTWLVPAGSPAVWRDIDLAVNANVAFFLSLVSEPLPNLTRYMEQAISDSRLVSSYYASAYPLIYYLARSYNGPLTEPLLAIARQLRHKRKLTPLRSALLLSAMTRLGARDSETLIAALLDTQQADGSWPAEAFCLDPARDGHKYYNGSESLTTALAVEALSAGRSVATAAGRPSAGRLDDAPVSSQYIGRVLTSARRDCRPLESDLAKTTLGFLEKMVDGLTGQEVIDLPRAFYKSLLRPARKPSEAQLARLSLANLYGWTAYTIIDDFLDDEGQPGLLPAATFSLRRSIECFRDVLPADNEFQKLVRQTFDIIDGANAWEQAHCRCQRRGQTIMIGDLPDYGDLSRLAERSLGHALTPLAVLRLTGVAIDDPLFTGSRQALRHYLIARQLNDDLHDWQTDINNGHMTYVVTRVLSDAGIGPGDYTWRRLLSLTRRQFWHDSLPELCQTVREHTALSRDSLEDLTGLRRANIITRLLDGLDAAADEALATQAQARVFLKQYQRTCQ